MPHFRATYSVQVGWEAVSSNAFVIGVSTLSGGGVLTSQLFTTFDGANDAITADVKDFSCHRGRDDYLGNMDSGEATIHLADPTGKYNPKNSSSVLVGKLIPMRPVRIRATYNAVTYGMFRGFVRSIEHDPEAKETTITAVDLFLLLSRVSPTIAATGSTTTGRAIGLVLDSVGFTESALRSLGTGDNISNFVADGTKSALSLIEGLLEIERGAFFVSGGGVATYIDRSTIQKITASEATLTAVIAAKPTVDIDKIGNRATVTKEGGVEQIAIDPNSAATFGWSDISSITSPYLATDGDAQRLAAWLVSERRSPSPPMRGVSFVNESDAFMVHMLSRELIDRVTINDPRAGSSADHMVQSIEHVVTDGGTLHRTVMSFQERTVDYFQIGISTFGGTRVLGY
jgi:hypothetical protein